jgi:glycosyltransferase involved in cell wall biosynthesis
MFISIITPSYNQADFIAENINSIKRQFIDDTEYEHIIIDGKSDDDTMSVVKQFNHNNLICISESDNGQSSAINKGFAMAKGDIIGWLNSDDIYYNEGTIKIVKNFFLENKDVDLLYGESFHIDKNGKIINKYPTNSWDYNKFLDECIICQPSVFFRRRILDENNFLDENLNFCMDYEFWLRLCLKGYKFSYIEEILSCSRLHENSKTISSKMQVHKEINIMLKRHIGFVPYKWISNISHIYIQEKLGIENKNYFFKIINFIIVNILIIKYWITK